jgi:hypothetical protein
LTCSVGIVGRDISRTLGLWTLYQCDDSDSDEVVDDFDIGYSLPVQFDQPSSPQWSLSISKWTVAQCQNYTAVQAEAKPIVRITGLDGSLTYPPKNGTTVGKCRQQTCFICCHYKTEGINMQWKCRKCGMPLCQTPRYSLVSSPACTKALFPIYLEQSPTCCRL